MKTRSMNQKISYRLFFTSMFGFALAGVLFTYIFYSAFNRQVWNSLTAEAINLATAYQYLGDTKDLSTFTNDGVYVTLLDADGALLYQSNSDSTPNLALDIAPEVIEAYENGTGTAQRDAAIYNSRTYCYAMVLPDGNLLHVGQDAQSLLMLFQGALPAMLLSLISFVVISCAIAYLSTRTIITPIMEMTRDLEHIQNNVPYRELSPFVSAIYSDRLLRANNEKIRQEFTANVSHELKSPLTSISGYAEMIAAGMVKPEDIANFAGKIHTEARRMITLVEDILRLSQLDTVSEHTEADLPFEQINLYDLGQECVERQAINAKRAYITLRFEGHDAFIQGNRKLMGELFQNLCDNAIRYNKPGGKVIVVVGRDSNNHAFMKVRDNGIGIPKESQGRIFERFYRVDKSHSKETGGTGLGLAIVKHIAMVHDAHVKLESELDVGTEISVTF